MPDASSPKDSDVAVLAGLQSVKTEVASLRSHLEKGELSQAGMFFIGVGATIFTLGIAISSGYESYGEYYIVLGAVAMVGGYVLLRWGPKTLRRKGPAVSTTEGQLVKSRPIKAGHSWYYWFTLAVFGVLAAVSSVYLVFQNPSSPLVLEWAVAIGTALLAFAAFVQMEDSKKTTAKNLEETQELVNANLALGREIQLMRVDADREAHRQRLIKCARDWSSQIVGLYYYGAVDVLDERRPLDVEGDILFEDLKENHAPDVLPIAKTWKRLVEAGPEHYRLKTDIIEAIGDEFKNRSGCQYTENLQDLENNLSGTCYFSKQLINDILRRRVALVERIGRPAEFGFADAFVLYEGRRIVGPIRENPGPTSEAIINLVTSMMEDESAKPVIEEYIESYMKYSRLSTNLKRMLLNLEQIPLYGTCDYVSSDEE